MLRNALGARPDCGWFSQGQVVEIRQIRTRLPILQQEMGPPNAGHGLGPLRRSAPGSGRSGFYRDSFECQNRRI